MALMPAYFTTSCLSRKKKSKTAKQIAADAEHKKFLASMGYTGKSSNGRTAVSETASVGSNPTFPSSSLKDQIASCTKKTIFDVAQNESEAVKREIYNKARRTAPAYSKGAYQFITEGMDLNTLGRKV